MENLTMIYIVCGLPEAVFPVLFSFSHIMKQSSLVFYQVTYSNHIFYPALFVLEVELLYSLAKIQTNLTAPQDNWLVFPGKHFHKNLSRFASGIINVLFIILKYNILYEMLCSLIPVRCTVPRNTKSP